MITKVEGFIVKTTDYGETSLVIQLLTKELGLIGVMGKGVKTLKSRLRTSAMRFTYGFFYLYYKEGKLSLLKDVDIINTLPNIHQDITLISYLNYLTDLSYQVYKESQNKEIYSLFISSVLKLEEGLDPKVITNILEMKYLPFLGVDLNVSECVECSSVHNIITVNIDKGGFICQNCYQNERIVNKKTIQYLRIYHYIEIEQIKKITIEDEVKEEIEKLLSEYYSKYTGIYLKSKEFLKKISQL